MLAHLDASGLVSIDDVGGQGKIPERFFRSDVEQADVAGFGGSGGADPLDTEVDTIAAAGYADDLVEAEFGADAGKFGAGPADVDGGDLLGEDLAVAVGAENAYRDLDLLAGLGALAHRLSNLTGVQVEGVRNQYYRIAWAGTVLKKPKFGEVQSGLRVGPVEPEVPSAPLRAGSSLRLKNGFAQDDSRRV